MNTEINRRRFLQQAGLYLAATSATCIGCSSAFGYSHSRGCALSASDAGGVGRLVTRITPSQINKLFYAYVDWLNIHTELEPSFAFMQEQYGHNAFALREDVVRGYSENGSVLFGINLINHLEKWPTLDVLVNYAAMLAVMAHEWAHIAQFAYGIETYAVKPMELMADFIAGGVVANQEASSDKHNRSLGKYDQANIDMAAGAMTVITSMGDRAFNSADHHGTPRERLVAYTNGITFHRQNPSSDFEDVLFEGHRLYI
ncbi:M48 family metalloprotease [Candidatus Spongiihabitans sp.]|uniref:M48 family metalloprotease n=1 Tax=Candidatus Spongiihabitans sp. TaxID=3101308 RepID=UPI003C7B2A84